MARRFVNIDRETPMLLPPRLQDWVPEDDPARLIVELVGRVDLSKAAVNDRGCGSEQYPPSMMVALLLHSYVHGVFSSREIEELTYRHVGMRYITGDTHPDHDTICKFRRENGELIREVFTQSLALALEAGVFELGCVSMDGCKIQGAVSKDKKLTSEKIEVQIRALEQESLALVGIVEGLLEQAEEQDRSGQDKASSPLSQALAEGQSLGERLEEAKKELAKKERRRARLEAARVKFSDLKQERSQKRETMREEIKEAEIGRVPDKRPAEVKPTDEINVSDPDAIKLKGRHGFTEGYNAQAVADCEGSGLLLAVRVSQEANDSHELEANVGELEATVGKVDTVLADRGYDNTYQIAKIEDEGGPQMLCLQQGRKSADKEELKDKPKEKLRGRRLRTHQRRETLYERLKQPENREKLKRRRETVEPSFGIIREQIGFRRFNLRGREKVDTEWRLVACAFNLRKLHRNPQWIKAMAKN